jgi:F-type H+-transporting ATPase subunit b
MHLDGWTIALQTINFAVLVWLLQRFLYRPVLRMIDQRKADIARQYSDAKAADDAAAARRTAVDAERAAIAGEREAALRAAGVEAQQLAATRRRQAESEAQALLADARQTIAKERVEALAEARRTALDLGTSIARRILAEVPGPLRAEAWLERIEEQFAALPPAEREELVRPIAQDRPVTVVTASAPASDVAESWRRRVRAMLGRDVDLAFEVDPTLIAGAELRFPLATLRFSLQSIVATIRTEIEHDHAR